MEWKVQYGWRLQIISVYPENFTYSTIFLIELLNVYKRRERFFSILVIERY